MDTWLKPPLRSEAVSVQAPATVSAVPDGTVSATAAQVSLTVPTSQPTVVATAAPVSVAPTVPVVLVVPPVPPVAPVVPVTPVITQMAPETAPSAVPAPTPAPTPTVTNPAVVSAASVVSNKAASVSKAPPAVRGPVVKPPPAVPTIQPDSVLWVSVEEDPSLNGRYMVNDASAIDFGYVGLVFLPDMSVEQAEVELKRVLEGRYLKVATVSVKLAKASYDRIAVQGAVDLPGEIKIGPGAGISLSEALRRAGGLKGDRESSRVKIVRGGMKTPFGPAAEGEVFSLVTEDGQLKVPDQFLRNDDLVYVFSTSATAVTKTTDGVKEKMMPGAGGKRVILLGEVPRRGVIEFAENEPCTLMYLLFKIGGLPRFAKADKITVIRRDKDGTEKSFVIDGQKLLNNGKPEDDLILETGDRIVVPARKISFL